MSQPHIPARAVAAGALALVAVLAGCGVRGHPAPQVTRTASAHPASVHHDTALPVLYTCAGHAVTRPGSYLIACGDGTVSLEHLTWASWTAAKATAGGEIDVNDCTPNCAGGTFHRISVHVTLSVPHGTPPYYTRMHVTGSGCGAPCTPITLGRQGAGSSSAPPPSPSGPASPPAPSPVATQATLNVSCDVGTEMSVGYPPSYNGTSPEPTLFYPAPAPTPSPGSGAYIQPSFQVTFTNNSDVSTNVSGFNVVFYDGPAETGSSGENVSQIITQGQSLTFSYDLPSQGAGATTCDVLNWYS